MEGGFRGILLNGAGCCALAWLAAAPALAAEPAPIGNPQGPIIQPEVERRDIVIPKINTEDFEVGAYYGLLSVEDFGTAPVYGVRVAYHVTEDLFAEAALGYTKAGKTSFERLSGAAPLLTDDQRKYTYYNVSLGFNVLPGESFFGDKHAFTNDLYLIAGLGSTKFAGDSHFTINYGMGYRLLLSDWVALHADVRDHMFNIDITGQNKRTHNMEISVGATVFF